MLSESLQIHFSHRVRAGMTLGEAIPPSGILTLNQIHSSLGFRVDAGDIDRAKEGDWLVTSDPKIGLGIRVADCTAILACGIYEGKLHLGAAHAGWRGSAQGILEAFSDAIRSWNDLQLWLSPSISKEHFEVGGEVLEALGADSKMFSEPGVAQKYYLDLKGLQLKRLRDLLPKSKIFSSSLCTFEQRELFSYRRDKEASGRHTAWICPS